MRRSPVALVLVSVAAAVSAPAAPADVSGPDIVGFLNAQRAAQGLPAGIIEDPSLSAACAKHNDYDRLNGGLTHGEDPSHPGYTPEGDQAGQKAVLYSAGSGPWTAAHDPFETAPIHLHQLLAPRLDAMGAAETQGWGCATTLASRNRLPPAADVTYTYPGDGATAWPPAQTAAEGPYTPGQQVGIPAGTRTGPYLYVMFDGPDLGLSDQAAVVTATLTGPAGLVPVAVADNHTTGLHGYLPTGAELIPRSPLAPLTKYTASITASVTTQDGSGPARNFTHNWSFTTGVLPNSVRVTAISVLGRRAKVTVTSEAPGAIVVASGPGPSVTKPVGSDGTATLDLTASGTWNMCAASGGGTSGYAAAQDCRPIAVSGGPSPPAGKPFGVSVPTTVAAGRRIVVKITSRASFSLRLTLRTPAGRVLVDGPAKTLAGGMTWIYRLPVAAPAGKAGHKVKLELKIRTGGKRYTVKRTVRFT